MSGCHYLSLFALNNIRSTLKCGTMHQMNTSVTNLALSIRKFLHKTMIYAMLRTKTIIAGTMPFEFDEI